MQHATEERLHAENRGRQHRQISRFDDCDFKVKLLILSTTFHVNTEDNNYYLLARIIL